MLETVSKIFFGAAAFFALLAVLYLLRRTRKLSLKKRKAVKNKRGIYSAAAVLCAIAGAALMLAARGAASSKPVMRDISPVDVYQSKTAYENLPNAIYAAGDSYYVHTGAHDLYGYLAEETTVTADDGTEQTTIHYHTGLAAKNTLMAAGGSGFHALLSARGELRLTGAYEYLQYLNDSTEYRGGVAARDCSFAAANSNDLLYVSGGDLWSAGYNAFGQLGDGTARSRTEPAMILPDVASVSVSDTHTLAVDVYGNLYGFGDNSFSEMGNRTTAQSTTPVKLMSGVKQAQAGRFFSIVLTKNGEVYAAGRNHLGQLGTGDGREYANYVKILDGIDKIAVCGDSCAALTASGVLYVWGSNANGQLGAGSETITKPVQLSSNAYDVAVGETSLAILTLNRDVYVTGTARPLSSGEALQAVWQFGATVPEDRVYRSVITMPERQA